MAPAVACSGEAAEITSRRSTENGKEGLMTRCDEMCEGDVYYCEHCGLEIEVVEECSHEDGVEAEEVCRVEEFVCCGEPMTLKED
jgi:hypothetical protein